MTHFVLRALLCYSGARAAVAVLVSGGLRSRGPALPWEEASSSSPAASSQKLTPEELLAVNEYREFKRLQLLRFIDTGKMPVPLPDEDKKKELWERQLSQAGSSPLDKKIQMFISDQARQTGMISSPAVPAEVSRHEEQQPKQHKSRDLFGRLQELPVPHSNGTRYTDVMGRQYKTMKFYHMHIPRTGGTSFLKDVQRIVVNNATLSMFSKEGCYNWKNRFPYVDAVVTMVRNPRSHVLSQFLYCSQGQIKGWTQVKKLRPWIEDWTKIMHKGTFVGDFASRSHSDKQIYFQKYVTHSFLPFHCYSPMNLMVQHFTCRGSPFNYSNQTQTDLAISNMHDTFFVGVNEAYHESICLLYVKVHDELPGFCDCENRTAWSDLNATHQGFYLMNMEELKQQYDVSNWRPETVEMVDNLTRGDSKLYQAAVARFAKELHEAERRFNTTIMCKDKLQKLSNHEDPARREFSLYLTEARTTLKARD